LDNDLSVLNSLSTGTFPVSAGIQDSFDINGCTRKGILSLDMRGTSVNNFIILINKEFHPWPTCGSVLFHGNYTRARFPEDRHPQSFPNLCFGLGFKWASRCGSYRGIEPRTGKTSTLTVRCCNHSARSHAQESAAHLVEHQTILTVASETFLKNKILIQS
jgi:hypothetical protein